MKLNPNVYRDAAYQQHFTKIGAWFAIKHATNDEWPDMHHIAFEYLYGNNYYDLNHFETVLALLFMAEIAEGGRANQLEMQSQ